MFFLFFSNTDINFGKKLLERLSWRFYTIIKTLSIISQVPFINKKAFAKAALGKILETFVIYISAPKAIKASIHPL